MMKSAQIPPVSTLKAQQTNNIVPLINKAKRKAQSDPKIKTFDLNQNARAANSQYETETHYEQQLAHESLIFAKMRNAKVPLVPALAQGALAPLQTSAAIHAQVPPVFKRVENALQFNGNRMSKDESK
jgi:hypothetical protein